MILVTGGTGFVGPRVVHALRGRDLPVRALARRPDREAELRAWGVELVQGDMTDADSLGSKYQGQRGPTPSRYWQNFEQEPVR